MSMQVRALALVVTLVVAGCTQARPVDRPERVVVTELDGPSRLPYPTKTPRERKPDNPWVTPRPAWLGKRVLPLGPTGMGIPEPTPPILRNRRFPTIEILPPPKHTGFKAEVGAAPPEVIERSSWRPKCPVGVEDLAYITMTFWGFDRERHTGEMLVHESVAEEVVGVFRAIYKARFPIEEMRVVTLEEQQEWNRAPTGDTNVTSSFECREATLGSDWSEHAYGLAIDINPFHNPYLRGDIVGPELAGAYTDRAWMRPGMIFDGDAIVRAFDAIGWGWGGRWSSLKDWMHFSQSGH